MITDYDLTLALENDQDEELEECINCGGFHEEENECEATNGKMD